MTQRAGDGVKAIADIHRPHLERRFTDLLKDQRDGACLGIVIRDGQRDPLALRVGDHDNELPRLGIARDVRCLDDHELGHVAEDLFLQNLVH